MAQIGKLHKPAKTDSKFALTGTIYLLGVPISIGLKKTEKGYDVESFGISNFDKSNQKPKADIIKPEEL